MITEKQIITWIESHGAQAACPELDISKINQGLNGDLYFYRNPHNLMWLSSTTVENSNKGKIYKTTLADIISEVRDMLINKI